MAALAERQHGVVAHGQLLELGLSATGIQRRSAAGRLHRIHRGVYAVGHRRLRGVGRWMAAVLACGPGALLSHRSAGAHLELLPTTRWMIDVTVERHRRGGRGITLHRSQRIAPHDRHEQDSIPVTSVMRTLVDLADVVTRGQLQRAIEAAELHGAFDLRALPDLRGRRGRGRLESLLEAHTQAVPTRSELERRFVALCRDAGLPSPAVNVIVAGVLVDAVWPEQQLVVELDGYAYHGTRTAFEEDRRRDTTLQLAGHRVLRVTHRRLEEEPQAVLRALRTMLGVSPGPRVEAAPPNYRPPP